MCLRPLGHQYNKLCLTSVDTKYLYNQVFHFNHCFSKKNIPVIACSESVYSCASDVQATLTGCSWLIERWDRDRYIVNRCSLVFRMTMRCQSSCTLEQKYHFSRLTCHFCPYSTFCAPLFLFFAGHSPLRLVNKDYISFVWDMYRDELPSLFTLNRLWSRV